MSQNNEFDHERMRALHISQKPYVLRALIDWINDNGGRPHIAIDTTWPNLRGLPPHLMKNPGLVLNLCPVATHNCMIENGGISVNMRFSTVMHSLWIPMGAIHSVFSPELMNMGTAFDTMQEDRPGEAANAPAESTQPDEAPAPKERPSFLSVVK